MSFRRRLLRKKPPAGWELVEPTIEQFEQQMKEAVDEDHSGKRKNELTWRIHRIHHEKNRYIFDLYYKRKAISKELYDYMVREKIADGPLISKWRKPGYEKLCSLLAISTRDTNFGTVSICRVPLSQRSAAQIAPSVVTGCVSCCSCDEGAPIWWNSPLPEPKDKGKRKAEEDPDLDDDTAKRLKELQGQ